VSRHITAEPITAAAFEPFGWLPVADTDPADGARRLEFEWGDPHLNVISHGPQEVERAEAGLRCEQMFRHGSHTQALLVLDTESVVAVAPAHLDFSRPEDVRSVRAFRLSPLDAFVLHRGTWHWGPFPLGDRAVHLYNVQGFGYARDNDSVDLSGYGLIVSESADR
jgi:ureidoglycolate hydrolase